MEYCLSKDINKILYDEIKNYEPGAREHFKINDAWYKNDFDYIGKCMRRTYWEMLNTQQSNEIGINAYRSSMLNKKIIEVESSILSRIGKFNVYNIDFNNNITVKDNIYTLNNLEYMLYRIKSTPIDNIEIPYPDDIVKVGLIFAITKINKIHLFYIHRGTYSTKEFILIYINGKIVVNNTVIGDIDTTQILNNIGILYNYYKLKKIPPACYNYYIGYNEILNAYKIGKISKQKCKKLRQAKMGGDYACEYCPYLSLCLKQK